MSRLLIAVSFAATTLISASPTSAAPIVVPGPGDCNVITMSADYVSRKGTGYNYDLHKYGGDGCEVMLDLNAQLFVGPKDYPVGGWEVGGSYSYNHQVRLETPLPSGTAVPVKVPVVSLLQIEGHITGGSGYFFDVQSVVNGQGLGSSFIYEDSFSYSKSASSLVSPNTNFVASVRGYVSLFANAGQTTSAQLIVDPFIVVDPGYAYADYFGVYQKKSDGTWVELNRDWIQPVPEPETWIMLLTGLGLLGAGVRRRTTLRTIRHAGRATDNSLDASHAAAASVTLNPSLATAAPICAMSLPGLAAKGLLSSAPHAHC